ncbi:MAG: PKD domain-containing protein [Candidatus Bathyarchaeota archaeon]|nr:MAG: PKD domain-containing protein [Candidatus Bathyarchaeota archaeon]
MFKIQTIIIVLCLTLVAGFLPRDHSVHSKTNIIDSPSFQPMAVSITVPDDYESIQEAVDVASEGDTVYVRNGTYLEHVFVDKSISIIGESPVATIIDGSGLGFTPVLHIFNATNVEIRNLQVQNTSSSDFDGSSGILAWEVDGLLVENCLSTDCYFGFSIGDSSDCRIIGNRFVNNHAYGLVLRGESTFNLFVNNWIADNPTGIYIPGASVSNNTFYRNNIIDNLNQLDVFGVLNTWDNGAEGNYWSDYSGVDSDGDGVGDTDHGVDEYPLVEEWRPTRLYLINSHTTVITCNYTVASFSLNQSLKQLSFQITGPEGSSGFCNITVPKELISIEEPGEKWLVMIRAEATDSIVEENGNATLIHFGFALEAGGNRVRVSVSSVYPPTVRFEWSPTAPSIVDLVNFTDTSIPSPNGTIEWREWDFGDGGSENTTAASVFYQFAEKSTFTVTLTVMDANNLSDSTSKTVTIRNLPPNADFNVLPAEAEVCEAVEFNASGSNDLDGSISQIQWDFGDGSDVATGDAVTVSHRFDHVGTFTVNLTVYDSDGVPDSVTKNVTVVKGRVSIQLEVSNETRLGQLLKVNASLINGCDDPVEAAEIEFHVFQNGAPLSENAITDMNGMARVSFSLNQVGEYRVNAVFKGNSDYQEISTEVMIVIHPTLTSMNVLTEDTVIQGQKTTIHVTLTDENNNLLSDADLELAVYNGSGWETVEQATTNQSGVVTFTYVPPTAGQHILKTVFDGSTTLAASEKEFAVTADPADGDYALLVLVAVILVVGGIVSFIVWKKRKPAST